jgi:fucose permease
MRLSLHEPVGALGILLAFGVVASVVSSAASGRLLSGLRVGPLVALGTLLPALALALEALAPSLWVVAIGFVIFGLGFGATDSALNVHASRHFGARQINWMHASYGLGATIGPLLVTAILSAGLSWRWTYGGMGAALAVLGGVFALARGSWEPASPPPAPPPPPAPLAPALVQPDPIVPQPQNGLPSVARPEPRKALLGTVLGGLTFAAVETGIESGAGIWGYIFLTAGRGLSHNVAGVAVAAYWAMMFVGRAVLGPVAERVGAGRVLAGAVGGVTLGAALMVAPGPNVLAVVGMMALGLAAAPIFPLFTLTTAKRVGLGDASAATWTVSLQVAASAVGSAVLPAGIGLAIGAFNAKVLAPSLLVLGLAMCGVYGLLARWPSGPPADRAGR